MENNKLIAEFMKLKFHTDFEDMCEDLTRNDKGFSKMLFNSSWNWLMLVIKKIKLIENNSDSRLKFELLNYQRNFRTIFDLSITTNIEITYERVIDFIKWYNENK